MTNYYSELKLSPDLSVEEIKAELLRLEQTWRKREITSPEAATAKLALINEAKKVFSSSSSKAAYDRELEQSRMKPVAPDSKRQRYAQWKKWYDAAHEYSKNEQYDLAETAIEKALSFMDSDYESAAFYHDAANIFRELRKYNLALSYINKAIIIDDTSAANYVTKGLIYAAEYEDPIIVRNDRSGLIRNERTMFKTAIEKAQQNKDNTYYAIACSLLAYSYCREIRGNEHRYAAQPVSNIEKRITELIAEATRYDDPWGICDQIQGIINMVNNQRGIFEMDRRKKANPLIYVYFQPDDDCISTQTIADIIEELRGSLIKHTERYAIELVNRIHQNLMARIGDGRNCCFVQLPNAISINDFIHSFNKKVDLNKLSKNTVNTLIERLKPFSIRLWKDGCSFYCNLIVYDYDINPCKDKNAEVIFHLTYYGDLLTRQIKEKCRNSDIYVEYVSKIYDHRRTTEEQFIYASIAQPIISITPVAQTFNMGVIHAYARATEPLIRFLNSKGMIAIPSTDKENGILSHEENIQEHELYQKRLEIKKEAERQKTSVNRSNVFPQNVSSNTREEQDVGRSQRNHIESVTISDEPSRIRTNRCRHCGGRFSGLLVKHCSKCGKRKDY